MSNQRELILTDRASIILPDPIGLPEWTKVRLANPHLPADAAGLLARAKYLFAQVASGDVLRKRSLANFDECAEGPLADFVTAFKNPSITDHDFTAVQELVTWGMQAAITPVAATEPCLVFHSTKHFDIEAVCGVDIAEAGRVLEEEWCWYHDRIFPGLPDEHLCRWAKKTCVLIGRLGRIRAYTTPTGPLNFNSDYWGLSPEFRRSLIIHELFHRVQYIFGYRVRYEPQLPYAWFSEGTAVWMEYLRSAQTTTFAKEKAAYEFPQLSLLNNSYYAGPTWMQWLAFADGPDRENLMVVVRDMLLSYERQGNPLRALQEAAGSNPSLLRKPVSIDEFHSRALINRATFVPPRVPFGRAAQVVVNRKLLCVPSAVYGYVRPLAGQIYQVNEAATVRLESDNASVQLLPPFGGGVGPGGAISLSENSSFAVAGLSGPGARYTLYVTPAGATDAPEPEEARPRRLVGVAGGWQMDSFGNLFRPGADAGRLVLAYQVNGFSSLEELQTEPSPSIPHFSYELLPVSLRGKGTQRLPWMATVRPATGFGTGIERIERRAWLRGETLNVETRVFGTASAATRFYTISLATKPGETLVQIRDYEGPPLQCGENDRDCDGHCRPVLPPSGGIFSGGRWQQVDAGEPVIPFVGYAIQPWPVPAGSPQRWIHYYDPETAGL